MSAVVREQVAALGWCVECYAGGQAVPAVGGLPVCQAHLRLMPARESVAGQLAFAVEVPGVPPALRAPYPTGVQEWCADCTARGAVAPRMGLPYRTAGDPTPLCLRCARSRAARPRTKRRRVSAQTATWIADLSRTAPCEVCGDAVGGGDCWRCGSRASFVAAARAVHVEDQAEAAAHVARVEQLEELHKLETARVNRAARRLRTVVAWQERLAQVVGAQPRVAKSGGRLRVTRLMGRKARAWYGLADFLGRDAAARREAGHSGRGRPPVLPLVVAVMAVSASWESGRGSMAGRDWTALYAGVSPRSVFAGWERAKELGCAELVEPGRILTVEERHELKRHRQRAVHDFTPLHRSRVDLRPYLGAAAQVLARLLARAAVLVEEHTAALAEQQAAAAAVAAELGDLRAWIAEQTAQDLQLQAEVDPAWTGQARQAAVTARAARAQASRLAGAGPADPAAQLAQQCAVRAQAERSVADAAEQAQRWTIFCTHPRRGPVRKSSSCLYWGLTFSAHARSHSPGRRPDGRGEEPIGASRSPIRARAGLTASSRPRTLQKPRRVSPGRAAQAAAMVWAKPLAAALAARWPYLQRFLGETDGEHATLRAAARERGLRLRKLADTLVPLLAPRRPGDRVWTAEEVAHLVEQYAGIISIIAPGDAHSPLAYTAKIIHRALTAPDAIVPVYSPVRDRYERDVLARQRTAEADTAASFRDARDTAAAAAALERAGAQTGRAAARAAASAARGPAPARRGRHTAGEAWPTPAAPGTGLPDGWTPGQDRDTSAPTHPVTP